MTRRDLEEAIVNLQYLILNRFNPAKVEEYAQQLRAFREELRTLEKKQYSLTSVPLRFPSRQN
jgi:hypothetical protein